MASPPSKGALAPMPRTLAFCTAMTCGVLAAMVAQILMQRRGISISTIGQMLSGGSGLNGRVALSWWAVPGSALVVGMVVGALMTGTALSGRTTRAIRWIIGALIVYGLAEIGHAVEAPAGTPADVQLLSSLVALCIAALMAMFGAFFALRR